MSLLHVLPISSTVVLLHYRSPHVTVFSILLFLTFSLVLTFSSSVFWTIFSVQISFAVFSIFRRVTCIVCILNNIVIAWHCGVLAALHLDTSKFVEKNFWTWNTLLCCISVAIHPSTLSIKNIRLCTQRFEFSYKLCTYSHILSQPDNGLSGRNVLLN
jgi:hypothetical protein